MAPIKNLPYYLIAAGLFLLLKFGYTLAGNEHLGFLLAPADRLLGWISGSASVYLPDKGYYHADWNILIDKSCSGFNFWLLCFLMLSFLGLSYLQKPVHKALVLPLALAGAYILTLLANTSRMLAALALRPEAGSPWAGQERLLHEGIGIMTNLSFLILIYLLTERLFLKFYPHAKPA